MIFPKKYPINTTDPKFCWLNLCWLNLAIRNTEGGNNPHDVPMLIATIFVAQLSHHVW